MENIHKQPLPSNNKEQLEVADIFRIYSENYRRSNSLSRAEAA